MGFFTPFEMPTGAAIPARQVSVADFGAVPGGQVNNTRAFAAAIDHLAALGGGRVEIPGGMSKNQFKILATLKEPDEDEPKMRRASGRKKAR